MISFKRILREYPRLRYGPKISSDQTFQTKIIPHQIFLSKITSDQTFQTEGVLIRPSPDHGPHSNAEHRPDHNQTMVRLFRPI